MSDYVLIQRLGAGNFGEVWLVLDRALNQRCAVKFIRPERIQDPSNFYHEPHTLVSLQHEHIVRVLDAGRLQDERLYISMEYIPRGSLEDIYKGAPVPLREALTLVSDACRGAEHAHAQYVVHRDIKDFTQASQDDADELFTRARPQISRDLQALSDGHTPDSSENIQTL